MSCIHGGLGQSQAGASRPRTAPPATARPEENLASGLPSAALPRARRAALQLRPTWRKGFPRRAPGRPPGAGVAHKGRTHRPLRLEQGTVPLRRASYRGLEARRRPRRGGQRHPGYRAGDDDGPSGSSRSPRDARVAAAGECHRARGGFRRHASLQPAAPRRSPTPPRESPGPDTGTRTRVTDALSSELRRARPNRPGPPHLLRVHMGGAPGGSQSAPAVPGPPRSPRGGRCGRENFVGGAAPGGGRGEAGVPRDPGAVRGAGRHRLEAPRSERGGRGADRA